MNRGFDTSPRRYLSGIGPVPNSGFNDFRGSSYLEAIGPPNSPPPLMGLGRSPFSSTPNPGIPPPSASLSQSYPSSGSDPFSGGIGIPYPTRNREQSPSLALATVGSNPVDILRSPLFDDGGFSLGLPLSSGGGPFSLPLPTSSGRPVTSDLSHYRSKRVRRAPSVGPGMGLGGDVADIYHRPGGRVDIRFRLTGEHRTGITLNDALSSERLQSRAYMLHDIAPDMSRKMTLKVKWSGYRSNLYDIPLSTDLSGCVNLQSLARRTARAVVHFMKANGIFLSWDRVVIHRLEEISPGNWILVLITH